MYSALPYLSYSWDLEKKRGGRGNFEVIIWGSRPQRGKGTVFMREIYYVILLF